MTRKINGCKVDKRKVTNGKAILARNKLEQLTETIMDMTEQKSIEITLDESEQRSPNPSKIISIKTKRMPIHNQKYQDQIVSNLPQIEQTEATLREVEEIFKIAFENAPIGIAIVSPSENWLKVNQSLCQILGYSEPEFLSMTFREITYPEDLENCLRHKERMLKGEFSTYQLEKRYVHKKGYVVWCQLNVSLVADRNGKPLYMIAQIQDITERKQQQEQIIQYADQLNKLYNQAPCGYLSVDQDGQFLMINDTALNWLGYTRKEIITQNNLTDLITPESLEDFQKAFALFKQQGWSQNVEFEMIRKNGTIMPALWNTTTIKDAKGNLITNLLTLFDITERKRAEAERQMFVSLIENSSDFIGLYTPEGQVIYINDAGLKLVGVDHIEETKSTAIFDYMTEEAHQQFRLSILPKMKETGAWKGESQLRHWKTEEMIEVQANFFYIPPPETGKHEYIAAIMRDIREEKRSINELRSNQQLLQAIFDNSQAGIFLKNTQGRYILGNQTFTNAFSLSQEDIKGLSDYDIFPQEIAAQLLANDRQVMAQGVPLEFEEVIPMEDGFHTFITMKFPIYHTSGIIYGVGGIATDITERKRIAKVIQKSEERFQLLAQATNDAVWDWDLVLNRVWRGPGYQMLFGYSLDEIDPTIKFCFNNIHPDDRERVISELQSVINSNESCFTSEYRFRRSNGSWADILERVYVIRTLEGSAIRVIGAKQDISHRKQAEVALKQAHNQLERRVQERTAELAAANIALKREVAKRKRVEQEVRQLNADLEQRVMERTAQLEATNKELEAFCYSVSHDLRSPLRSIDGFSLALLEDYQDQLDDVGKDYLRRVRVAAQRMDQLINDLLQLSRFSRGELQRQQVDLSAIAQEIAGNLQATKCDRQVEFIIPTGIITFADERLLRVVLENLLGNSWKYTSKHPTARIELGVIQSTKKNEKKNLPIYFLRDDGAGFNIACAQKLFGVFQRLHRDSEFEGTGIGLATVQRIIHRHGGQIWAESVIEKGSTFYFTLG